jgi:hypothetical protein
LIVAVASTLPSVAARVDLRNHACAPARIWIAVLVHHIGDGDVPGMFTAAEGGLTLDATAPTLSIRLAVARLAMTRASSCARRASVARSA